MKRLRLNHNYHDANLHSVEVGERQLTFVIDLDPHWNNKVPERRHLFFGGVRNMEEVLGQLGQEAGQSTFEVNAEIVGLAREGGGRILVDVMKVGPLYIDCKSLIET